MQVAWVPTPEFLSCLKGALCRCRPLLQERTCFMVRFSFACRSLMIIVVALSCGSREAAPSSSSEGGTCWAEQE